MSDPTTDLTAAEQLHVYLIGAEGGGLPHVVSLSIEAFARGMAQEAAEAERARCVAIVNGLDPTGRLAAILDPRSDKEPT